MVEMIVLVFVGVLCGAIMGFWLGRVSARYYVGETGEGQQEEVLENKQEKEWNHAGESAKRVLNMAGAFSIGSPVNGMVVDSRDGKKPEIILDSTEEKIFAPTGGKVVKLCPLGNEILFRTEEGVVLRIKVGEGADELQNEYFRPKVIRNEVVNKGKLLLEYDKNALEAEGIECSVSVTVEETGIGEKVIYIAGGKMKIGEGIFEISKM